LSNKKVGGGGGLNKDVKSATLKGSICLGTFWFGYINYPVTMQFW